MKITNIKHIKGKTSTVVDCFVMGGYLKGAHGSLP